MLKKYNFSSWLLFSFPLIIYFLSENVYVIWIFMEMLTLLFLLRMWNKSTKKSFLILFLLIQMISSVFIFMVIYMEMSLNKSNLLMSFLVLFIFLKMGMIPFHSWSLLMMKYLALEDIFLFFTSMKFLPFFLCISMNSSMTIVLLILNMFLSPFYVFKFNSFINVLFFSSLFWGSMIVMMGFMSNINFFAFMLISYSFLSFLIFSSLGLSGFILVQKMSSSYFGVPILLILLSIVGVPYGVGFIMKVCFIQGIYASGYVVTLLLVMFLSSVMFSYHYLKILYFFLLDLNVNLGFLYLKKNKNNLTQYISHLLLISLGIPLFLLGSVHIF